MLVGYCNADMQEYEYDETGNLIRVTYEDGSYEEYVYDGNGNIVSVKYVKCEEGDTEETIDTDINQEDAANQDYTVNQGDAANQDYTVNQGDAANQDYTVNQCDTDNQYDTDNQEGTYPTDNENSDDIYSADITVKKDIEKENISGIHTVYGIIAAVAVCMVLTTLITGILYRKKRNHDTKRGDGTYEKKNTEDKE